MRVVYASLAVDVNSKKCLLDWFFIIFKNKVFCASHAAVGAYS